MIVQWMKHLAGAALVLAYCVSSNGYAAEDPLPSWNDGPTKQSILDYVTRVTKEGGPDYVEPKDRLATFDNDGTLWIEQPMYNQFVFAIEEDKALDEANAKGWTVVDMKNDWNTIFPSAKAAQ